MDERCCEQIRVRGERWPTYRQCTRVATVTVDGKSYCKQHDPVAIKRRQEALSQKFNMQFDEKVKLHRIEAAALALLNALTRYRVQHDQERWPQDRPCRCELCVQADEAIKAAKGST